MTTMNITSPAPAPAGATTVGEWRLDGGTARRFTGTSRVVGVPSGDDVHLVIAGDQGRDGRIDRYLSIDADTPLYAGEARALAAELLAAADELDALAAADELQPLSGY